MVSCIKRVAKNVLGKSRHGAPLYIDVSWWTQEVKSTIKIKRDSYRDLKKNNNRIGFKRYKLIQKEDKIVYKLIKKEDQKVVQDARAKVYKELYEKLDSKR